MPTCAIVILGVLGYATLCALHAIALFAIKKERMPINSDDIIIFAEQEYKCPFVFMAYLIIGPVVDALFIAVFAFVVLSSLIADLILWLLEKARAKNT